MPGGMPWGISWGCDYGRVSPPLGDLVGDSLGNCPDDALGNPGWGLWPAFVLPLVDPVGDALGDGLGDPLDCDYGPVWGLPKEFRPWMAQGAQTDGPK